MQDYISQLFLYVTTLTGGNDFLTTAIIGGIAVAMRNIPKQIYRSIKYKLRYVVILDETGKGNAAITNLMQLADEYSLSKSTRIFSLDFYSVRRREFTLVPGLGTTPCYYNGRFFFITKKDLPSDGAETQKYRYTVVYYGLSKAPLFDFLNSRKVEPNLDEYTIDIGGRVKPTKKTYLDTVTLADHDKQFFKEQIANFTARKDFAALHGMDHKMVILLPGEPGTGKTTMAKVIASELGRDLVVIKADENGVSALTASEGTCARRVFVLEDAHSYMNLLKPEYCQNGLVSMGSKEVSLDAFLGVLQPLVPAKELVLIITANDLDKLHPAIFRPGRVTAIHELSRLSPDLVKEDLTKVYGNELENIKVSMSWRGCDLAMFKELYYTRQYQPQQLINYIEHEMPPLPEVRHNNLSDHTLKLVS